MVDSQELPPVPDPSEVGYSGRWVGRVGGRIVSQGGIPEQARAAAAAARHKEAATVEFIPLSYSLHFPEILDKVVASLPAGVDAYIAGGAVRDAFLRRQIHDLDFVMTGDVLKIARKVADRIGAAYYPMDEERSIARLVLVGENGQRMVLDFSAFRGSSLEADLRMRDFTMNAMAVDVHHTQELLDPLGGAADLKAGVLRACSPTSLQDDPVRVLRAVRMAAAFNLRIFKETRTQLKAASAGLANVSVERVRDELFKILESPRPATSLQALDLLGALKVVLPELPALKGVEQSPPHVADVYDHTLSALEKLTGVLDTLSPAYHPDLANNLVMGMAVLQLGRFRQQIGEHIKKTVSSDHSVRTLLYLAALYHDIEKPATRSVDETGRIRFFEHDELGAKVISRRARRLHLSNEEIERLSTIVRHHMRPFLLAQTGQMPSRRAIYRFFRDTGEAGVDICLLSMADVLATYGSSLPADHWQRHLEVVGALLEAWWTHPEEVVAPPVLINGSELMAEMDLKPGPLIGELLSAIREGQAEGKIATREDALSLVRSLLDHSRYEAET